MTQQQTVRVVAKADARSVASVIKHAHPLERMASADNPKITREQCDAGMFAIDILELFDRVSSPSFTLDDTYVTRSPGDWWSYSKCEVLQRRMKLMSCLERMDSLPVKTFLLVGYERKSPSAVAKSLFGHDSSWHLRKLYIALGEALDTIWDDYGLGYK